MKEEHIGFGLAQKEHPYQEYKGKWVMIYPFSSSWTFMGRIKDYDGENVTLNPFLGSILDKEVGLVRGLIEDNSKFKINAIMNIEPTTKETIEGYLEFDNAQKRKNCTGLLKGK